MKKTLMLFNANRVQIGFLYFDGDRISSEIQKSDEGVAVEMDKFLRETIKIGERFA